jgi:hypothetical protein
MCVDRLLSRSAIGEEDEAEARRLSEVRHYVEERRRNRDVRCDDGTLLEELGVP